MTIAINTLGHRPKEKKPAFKTPPAGELAILNVLKTAGTEMHAPAISRASNGTIAVAQIYVLLKRLEQRNLVRKREVLIPIGDIHAKRVFYEVNKHYQP